MSDSPSQQPRVPDNPSRGDSESDAAHSPRQAAVSNDFRTLRVWPAALLLIGMWGLRMVPAWVADASMAVMMTRFMGPLVCAGLIVLWWLFLSRALLKEKLIGFICLATIGIVTTYLADKSIRGFGTMIYAVPWGITGFAVALVCLARAQEFRRTWIALLSALICFGYWDLVRTDEVFGDFRTTRSWRWEPTVEDRFVQSLAANSQEEASLAPDIANQNLAEGQISTQQLSEPEWPAFRGSGRRGVQPGVVLGEDWNARPPRELWRVSVGPGWSSFSVAGNRLFTQEQRGEHEVVACYDAESGAPLWVHQDESRFWEVIGGAGPRATPTLSEASLFALGATGLLHRLDSRTGQVIWQQDISKDASRKPPTWGFASSPLVSHGVVIVYAGGSGDKGILAYDVETGDLRWSCPAGDHSYSSPQLAEIRGVSCVLMLTNEGLTFADPADGRLLGNHHWEFEGYRVVQPLVVDDSSVLLGTAMGTGTQRVEVTWNGQEFVTEEVWTSRRMNPYYNDYVAHQGYLYGFDNNIFACVDLATGQRKWKKGRYGNGQVLLLPDHDQLLVISEDGELVLLRATPEKLIELARHQALTGRTWNHPVLVGNRLFVRNGQEAACFEVPIETPADESAPREPI